ncbi:MAG: hypothetical protein JXB13_06020 [Phycisphaerae bacterium]|nr:hypothetical protein [Phycisphaerae bacterium]
MNANQVRYLLVGGYAVSYHGYPRATADLDVWIAVSAENTQRLLAALKDFGFDESTQTIAHALTQPGKVLRMGVPPLRIEVQTAASGVVFDECYARRINTVLDGIPVPIIHADDLKANKRAAGRPKDLDDLDHLL